LGGVLGTVVAGPIGGAAGVGITSALLGIDDPGPTQQFLPVGSPVPLQITPTIPVALKPDPLIWTGAAFIGSDSAQRTLASQLWNTLKISPEEVVLLHNNTTKAQFLIDGKRLLLELTTSVAPSAAAPTFAPSPIMATPISTAPQTFTQPQVGTPGFQTAALPLAVPVAAAVVGTVVTRGALATIFGGLVRTLGAATGLRAISRWILGNPATAAALAATLGLSAAQLFDTLADDAIAKNVLLTKDDVKGFRRTLRVGKRFSKLTRVRTRIKKVPMVPSCPAKITC